MSHKSRSHAILSASSSHRWLNCPPSAKLNAERSDVVSEYAKEGTCAHELAEYKLRKTLGQSDKELHEIMENLDFFDSEMDDCTDSYADFVMEQFENAKKICPDTLILIEQKLDFSEYVPDGFGTGDCVIVADGTLQVIDFKYGLGVLVSAEKNSQMMLYALGSLAIYRDLYDIEKVRMTIFQPRRENVSDWEISVSELLDWAENVLKPTAQLAENGDGAYNSGDWCTFCRAKATCRKRAEDNLKIARLDFRDPPLLSDDEISEVLEQIPQLTKWAEEVQKYALEQALHGKNWAGFKLVEGRSVRKYTDENAVAERVKSVGKDPFEQKILGITDMTKLLGRKNFEELLNDLIYKPKGKPVLVPEADKRPKIDVFDDFKED